MLLDNAIEIVLDHVKDISGVFYEDYRGRDGIKWVHHRSFLTVISSVSEEKDKEIWLHVSVAHRKRMPTYDEIKLVKEHFIGRDKYAIMVFPPDEMFVNIHSFCLHIYHCLGKHPLPEFSGIIGNLRTI